MRECLLNDLLPVRLQVDDGEDECYDDDYPYDTDDSNGNFTIILLTYLISEN